MSLTPISQHDYQTSACQLFIKSLELQSDTFSITDNGSYEAEENALENEVIDVVHAINQTFCTGLSHLNVREEWVQTCLKTLGTAREHLMDDGALKAAPETFKLQLLQRCIFLFLSERKDEAYKAFEHLPKQEKEVVYSSVSDQLYKAPEETVVGQDSFYMTTTLVTTKVQALIASWKKSSSSPTKE